MKRGAVRSKEDEQWRDLGRLFQGRPSWSLQAMSSPGSPPAWCCSLSGEVELSVTVEEGLFRVYVMETDQDVSLASIDELVAWLNEHKDGILGDRQPGIVDRLKRGSFFDWG